MSGGAVLKACEAVVVNLIEQIAEEEGVKYENLDGTLVSEDGAKTIPIAEALRGRSFRRKSYIGTPLHSLWMKKVKVTHTFLCFRRSPRSS